MKNILIFDSSSSNLFIAGQVNGSKVQFCKNYDKSKMSVAMPGDMIWLKDLLAGSGSVNIIAGSGPGSFTGIKSGLSFFLALLYSLGIQKIDTVSSSRIFAVFSDAPAGLFRVVAIPFNKGEYFFSVYDSQMRPLMEDVFMKLPLNGFSENGVIPAGSPAVLISPVSISDELIRETGRYFEIKGIYAEALLFEQEKMKDLGLLQTVDISNEPMILNYVTYPANIDANCDIYVKN